MATSPPGTHAGPRRTAGVRVKQVLLIALMAIGSVIMWLAWPVFLLYVGSLMSESSQPTLGPIVMIIIALPLGMIFIGKFLAWLDRIYGVITGTLDDRPYRGAWTRSMRGERESTRKRTVLDIVMIVSVAVAAIAMAIWFFFFAGSSLPT